MVDADIPGRNPTMFCRHADYVVADNAEAVRQLWR
jgi:hypothetical protein